MPADDASIPSQRPEHTDPALPDWIAELLERLTIGLETSDGDGFGSVAYRYDDHDELHHCPLLLVEPTLAEITGGGALDGTTIRFDIHAIDLLAVQEAFTRVIEVRYQGEEDADFGTGPYLDLLGEVAGTRVRVVILLSLQSLAPDVEELEEVDEDDEARSERGGDDIDELDDGDDLDEANAEDEPWSDPDGEGWRRRR